MTEQPRFLESARGEAWDWLVDAWQWPKAGLLCAVFLIGLIPLLFSLVGLELTLVF